MFALNVYYNFVRQAFKEQTLGWEIPSLCSSIKTMMSWNAERTATTTRERCGGMGFLSSSRFAEYLAVAHTSLTAEGDNRVLMHKVTKDLTKAVTKKGYVLPKPKLNVKAQIGTMDDVSSLELISDLFRFRVETLLVKLGAKTAELKKQGKSPYEVNMMGTSNLIQDLAMAYGERRMIDSCLDFLGGLDSAQDRKVMECVFRVAAIDCVKRDLSFYISEKAIKPQAGANLLIA
jgi:acyl-CoA oxidase